MDNTPNRGYPFPQCAPPYVQDAADLPYDLYILAQAMNTDVTALAAQALAALNPPAAALTNLSTIGPISSGQIVPMDLVSFDNTGTSMALTAPTPRLVIPSAGMYDVTGTVLGNPASGTINSLTLQVLVNGVVADSVSEPAFTAGTGALVNAAWRLLLAVNDAVQLAVTYPGGQTMTFTNARLAAVRTVKA